MRVCQLAAGSSRAVASLASAYLIRRAFHSPDDLGATYSLRQLLIRKALSGTRDQVVILGDNYGLNRIAAFLGALADGDMVEGEIRAAVVDPDAAAADQGDDGVEIYLLRREGPHNGLTHRGV